MRESLEVRDEEGRVGKGGVISPQPDLVAPIPSQGVEVAQKSRFLYVLLHEFVQCEDCSKEFTVQLKPVMSVIRCEYFCVFSAFRWSMFIVSGKVSS